MTDQVNELVNQLKQETETAGKPPSPPVTQDNGGEGATFEEPPVREISDEDLTDKETIAPFSGDKAMKIARSWIKSFSSLLKVVFKPIYKSTVLAKGDIQKMQEFRDQNRGMSEKQMEEALHSKHELYPVANRFDKYLKAVEEIPLDADEIESIAEPLSELIVKYKKLQLGPEWSLVFAVALVMLPRLTPVIPDLSKIFTSAQDKAK